MTGTLMLTSLFICAALFLFLIYGGLADMREGGGKYFHYNFRPREAVKSLLNRILPGEPVAVALSTAALSQGTAGLSTATLSQAQERDSPPAVAAGSTPAATQAPDAGGNGSSADGRPSWQGSSAAEPEAASRPLPAQAAAPLSPAGAVKPRPGGNMRPPQEKTALPPKAGAKTQGAPRAWPDANLSIDGILATAGIVRGPKGLLNLSALASVAGTVKPMFRPRQVLSIGGRLGQGAVSMETGSAATLNNFNINAKGLSSTMGPPPSGPAIPAGRAPSIPAGHVAYIIEAARAEGIDPALLTATAARESHFAPKAYRAEPHLKQVSWRTAPGRPLETYFDGSIGPTQVLRSNFRAQGIDNDAQAYALANNYRISARIIRGNLDYFPGNTWKAVAAYNVGKYGAKSGRIPANNYTDTIISWRSEYQRALEPYQ